MLSVKLSEQIHQNNTDIIHIEVNYIHISDIIYHNIKTALTFYLLKASVTSEIYLVDISEVYLY